MNDTRNIILLSSLRLFLQHEYKEVTMKDILDASGQAKGTFYYHFKDKEQVFGEAAKYFIDNYVILNFNKMPCDSVDGYIKAYLRAKAKLARKMTLLGDNTRLVVFLNQASVRVAALKEQIAGQEQAERVAWLRALDNGRRSGEITSVLPDDSIADLFMHTYQGVRSEQLKEVYGNSEALRRIGQDWAALYSLISR